MRKWLGRGRGAAKAAFVLVAAIELLFPRGAYAQGQGQPQAQKPTIQVTEYSTYEKEAIDAALADMGREVDPAPEGKTIREIHGVRLEVLEPRDPGPELLQKVPIVSPLGRIVTKPMLNWLHILSKERIIRRELLLKEGEPYVQVLVEETARNMRANMPLQVSLVVIVPLKNEDANTVDLLMITKDIWSLRLSFDTAVTPGGIENLVFVPQETNFLGLHHTVSTRFQLRPETYSLGVGYNIPRFGQSWIGAGASAGIVFNKLEGSPEGSNASISVGQPIYSTRTPWGWAADASYAVGVTRRYSNAHVLAFDSQQTPERDRIPFQYKTGTYAAGASLTRSFGWAYKNNFSISANATTADYQTFDLSRFNPAAVADFRRRALPTGESRVYPALSWAFFTPNYLRTVNIGTLALQEDVRLGPSLGASIYPVLKALGSSRNVLGISGSAGYTVAMGDGFASASVSTTRESTEDGHISDGSVGVGFRAVSPRFPSGRLVMSAGLTSRYENYLNARSTLGGDDRLRGYPTAYFFGKDSVVFNLEYRTSSVELLKVQFGAVVFYDAGDAADGLENLHAKQSVGTGLRVLFPQVNRLVFRFDVAAPLQRGPFPETGDPSVVPPFGYFFAFDQAF